MSTKREKNNHKFFIAIILLLLITPIFQLNFLLDKQLSSRFIFLSIILLAGTITIHNQLKFINLYLLIGLFYLWNLTTILWARNFAEAMFQSQVVFLGLIVFVYIKHLCTKESDYLLKICKVVSLANFILLLVGYVQIYQLLHLDLHEVYAITGLNGHKNLYSSFLFLNIPFLILGKGCSTQKLWSRFFSTLLIFTITILVILKTRAVYVGLFVGCLLFVVLSILAYRSIFNFKQITNTILTTVIIGFLFFAIKSTKPDNVEMAAHNSNTRTESSNERLALWRNSINMVKDHPFAGVGAGNWQIEYPVYVKERISRMDRGNVTFQRPHNDFIWTLSETGLIGFALLISVFMIIIWGSLSTIMKPDCGDADKLEIIVLLSGFLGYLAISFFDFPKERIEHLIYSNLIMVLLFIKSKGTSFWHKTLFEIKASRLVPVWILLILSICIGYYRIKGENQMRYAYLARGYGHWERLIEHCGKAKSIFYTIDLTSIPVDWYRGIASFSLGKNSEALSDFTNAEIYNPNNFNVLNNLGSAHENNENHKLAEKYYLAALKINPYFDEARLNLFVIYYNQKRFRAGLEILKQCSESERKDQYFQLVNQKINSIL